MIVSARDVCFWGETVLRNWSDSRIACEQLSGVLAKVMDSTENQKIAPAR